MTADPAARIVAGMVLDIRPAHLSDPAVRELVAYHQRDMLAMSPPGTSFALDESGLSGPGITLLGAWRGRVLVGIGAMKRLSADSAELKSMRTHADHLGRGVASAVLDRLIAIARAEGISRLSLETGT
ncbi:MAG TPA: N-acetyltransferase, partial [Erythrobacter sp.]|nr:N-acetyltransferase [Erythrobacter sp.]